jgi:hypothetical protein
MEALATRAGIVTERHWSGAAGNGVTVAVGVGMVAIGADVVADVAGACAGGTLA